MNKRKVAAAVAAALVALSFTAIAASPADASAGHHRILGKA